jgi:hypothetical protein
MPNPNTNFTAGAVYTAAQANRFPRGVMAVTTSTSNTITAGVLTGLNTSFTAVANRNYRISVLFVASAPTAGSRCLVTFTGGSARIIDYTNAIASFPILYGSAVQSYAAGTQNIQVTITVVSGTIVGNAGVGNGHQLVIEDIGPT